MFAMSWIHYPAQGMVIAVLIGLVESLLARLALRRVPLLLTTSFLLCLFALLVAWKGGTWAGQ